LVYELGVLLFNLTSDECIFANNYDKIGNFVGIMNALNGEINLDDLADGYFAEAQNYGINKEETKKLFKRAKQYINEY